MIFFTKSNNIYRIPDSVEAIIISPSISKTRKIFEKPIEEHQLVKQMLANMSAGCQYSRLLWLESGWERNQGIRATRSTSLAKWIACREAERATAGAVQV